ncbi:hypothetical protein [Empedobacter brevis]|uniref:hypothetical protein n=1 Tax=Empedobacter brevis TaxID=247 RepID=UPI0028A00475|nr:hypothetical protein [Empedobacter brevis]
MNQFSWIKNYKNNENVKTLTDIIPDLFEQYYMIHWKIGIIDHFPFEKYPSNNFSIKDINQRIKIEREFGLFLNPRKSKLYREISLDELSQKFELQKTINILDHFIDNPVLEFLENQTLDSIEKGLNDCINSQHLHLHINNIEEFYWEENYKKENINISISEYLDFQKSSNFDSNSFLFPDDLSWCLITYVDLPLIFCTNSNNPFDLEMFPIKYNQTFF